LVVCLDFSAWLLSLNRADLAFSAQFFGHFLKNAQVSTIVAGTRCGCIGPWDPLGFDGLIHNTNWIAWLFLTGGEFGAGNFPSI
jgi:hypothetical protein